MANQFTLEPIKEEKNDFSLEPIAGAPQGRADVLPESPRSGASGTQFTLEPVSPSSSEGSSFSLEAITPAAKAKELMHSFGAGAGKTMTTDQTIEKVENFFTSKPVLVSKLEEISKRTGVDLEDLKHAVYLQGGSTNEAPTPTDALRAGVGNVGRKLLGGLPQQLWRMTKDKNTEAALDEVNELVQGNKSTFESGTELGTNVVSGFGNLGVAENIAKGLGAGKTAINAGKLLTYPAVGRVLSQTDIPEKNKQERADAEWIGTVLGAVPGGAVLAEKGASKFIRTLFGTTKDVQEFRAAVEKTMESPEVQSRVEAAKRAILTGDTSNPDMSSLIKKLDKNKEGIQSVLEQNTQNDLLKQVGEDIEQSVAIKELANHPKIGASQDFNYLANAASKLSSNMPVALDIDRSLGGQSQMAPALRHLSDKMNLNSLETASLRNNLKTAFPGKNEEQLIDIFDSMKAKGPIGTATEADIIKTRQIFSELADLHAERTGVVIPHDDWYIRDMRKQGQGYTLAVARQIDVVAAQTGLDLMNLNKGQLATLKREANPDFLDLLKEVEFMQGAQKNSKQFSNSLTSLINRDRSISAKLEMTPSFMKEKVGGIPEFIKEKNPLLLAENWLQSSQKAGWADEIRQMSQAAELAKKAGMPRRARWIEATRDSLLTTDRSDVTKQLSHMEDQIALWADKKGTASARAVNDIFPIMHSMSQNFYPSVLGWNPGAIVTNLASPFTQIWPELGGRYGAKIAVESSLDLAKAMRGGIEVEVRSPILAKKYGKQMGELTSMSPSDLLTNEGVKPVEWTGEMVSQMNKGLKPGALRAVADPLQRFNQGMGMAAFSASETQIRLLSTLMGRRVAKDLMNKNVGGLQFLEQMRDLGAKRAILKGMREGNIGLVQREVQSYFTANHTLNFNPTDMFEIGRSMPAWSRMFSKMPTTVFGKTVFETMGGGGPGIARKLAAPAAILFAANKLASDDLKESKGWKLLLGKEGLTRWSPAANLVQMGWDMSHGKMPSQPIAQMIGKGLDIATAKDEDDFKKKADNAMFELLDKYIMPVSGSTFFPKEERDTDSKTLELITRRLRLMEMGKKLLTPWGGLATPENKQEDKEIKK